ncbi:MAG: LysR family transcriptional regulator [Pseudomonadota bacterium]
MNNVDQKSLQVFSVLLKECSVTRAAQVLNMTQSAVSHTLGRLRELFRDPLFVSMGRGMVPTPRALELAEPLRRTLDAMDSLVRPVDAFDPARFDGVFRIATTDYIGFIMLPMLVKRLSEVAPEMELQIRPLKPQDDLASLKSGELDLILWNEETAPPTFHMRKLFTDRLKAIVRVGHPDIDGSLSLEQFRVGRHLRISSDHGAVKELVDRLYEKSGVRSKTSVTLPHFLLAYRLVAESNLIGAIAELTARRIVKELPLQVLEQPVDEASFIVSLVWHERRHADPGHRWLRSEIAGVAEQIRAEQASYRG